MDWFLKLQSNVKIATYGSEFSALCTALDQIHDVHYTIHSLGIPIMGSTYLFSDSLAIFVSSTKSGGKIAKGWNILSYHQVREAVIHNIVTLSHINGKNTPADVLSNHISSSTEYELMYHLIFWRNNENKKFKKSSECNEEGSIA